MHKFIKKNVIMLHAYKSGTEPSNYQSCKVTYLKLTLACLNVWYA